MVAGGGRDNGLGLAHIPVNLPEALQKALQGTGADGEVASDYYITPTQFTGNQTNLFLRRRILDPEQVFRQRFAEAPVNLANALGCDGDATLESPRSIHRWTVMCARASIWRSRLRRPYYNRS